MTIIFYILGAMLTIIILIFVTGLLLPAERVEKRNGFFEVPPQKLFEIVTNNNDWHYRSNLKNLVIIEKNNELEIWDEISEDGTVIRFTCEEKRPYSFYAFNMESKIFTGYWTGEFKAVEGGTVFTATEYIRVKNPFIKTLSYMFFNIGKLMDTYQSDLKKKVDELNHEND